MICMGRGGSALVDARRTYSRVTCLLRIPRTETREPEVTEVVTNGHL